MSGSNPASNRRLIGLLAGVAFFATGIAMMMKGIAAKGALDIQSAILSGKVETGSAGLIIAFLSTFIIIFSMGSVDHSSIGMPATGSPTLPRKPTEPGAFDISSMTLRFFWVLVVLLLTEAVAAWGMAAVGRESPVYKGIGAGMVVVGIACAILFLLLMVSLFAEYFDDEVEPAKKA